MTLPDQDDITVSLGLLAELFEELCIVHVRQVIKSNNKQKRFNSYGSFKVEDLQSNVRQCNARERTQMKNLLLRCEGEAVRLISAEAMAVLKVTLRFDLNTGEKRKPGTSFFGTCNSVNSEIFSERTLYNNVDWKFLHGCRLTLLSRSRIQDGLWLADDDVNAGQECLRIQFPSIAGLRSTQLFDVRSSSSVFRRLQLERVRSKKMEGDGKGCELDTRQLQILHIPNHWIVVSNIHSGPANLVHAVDSHTQKPDDDFGHSVAAVFRFQQEHFSVEWPKVMQQKDGSSCGVYAIAFAMAICLGESLQEARFIHEVCTK